MIMKTARIVCRIILALACGLPATLKAQDLFVTSLTGGTIGEYGLDGSTVNASLVSGLGQPLGLAISGNDLFVVNSSGNSIGEYTTSGATVNASLISVSSPVNIVISGSDLFVLNN